MNNVKRAKIQTLIVASCVIFAVLLLVALIMNAVKLTSLKSRERELAEQLTRLNEIIVANDGELDYRKNHYEDYIDEYAREYLNMKGKDDITFIGK